MQKGSEDLELVEAEEDVRELEQHVADQQMSPGGRRNGDEMKAREGLFLLSDALEIARRRLQAERPARGTRCAAGLCAGQQDWSVHVDISGAAAGPSAGRVRFRR